MLSHYDAVLWYTGDDIIPREPTRAGGNASRLAVQELYEVREFLNEGGRALYTGKHAGTAHTSGNAVLRPVRERGLRGPGGAPLPTGVWLGRRRERRPRVLVRRRPGERGAGLDGDGRRRSTCSAWTTRSRAGVGPQRRGQRRQPGQRATRSSRRAASCRGRVPAVRELGVRQVRPPRRAVRPAYGRLVRPLPDRGRVLQAPDEDGRPSRRAAETCRSGPRTTRSPPGTSCSSRCTLSARTTGRRCPLRAHDARTPGDSCPEGWRELHPHLDHYQTLNEPTARARRPATAGCR